jgi:ABC-type amino acid transport system permease subunit
MRAFRNWLVALALLPGMALAQQQQSPIQQFVSGLQSEFTSAVPVLITIIGVVFVFAWLIRFVMAKVKQASR